MLRELQRSTRASSCANASVEKPLDLGCPGGARILVGFSPVDDFDDESHADYFLEAPLQIRLQLRAVDRGVHDLDQHRHLLALLDAHALDDADIFAVAAALGGNDAADRLGEDIHAAQLHHGVVAAENAIELLERAAAPAGFGNDARDIVDVETDLRRAPAVQSGDVDAAFLALGQHGSGFRIGDFQNDRVFLNVHPCALAALGRHHAAFVRAVRIVTGSIPQFFELNAIFLSQMRTKRADAEAVRVDAELLFRHDGQMPQIR